MTRRLTIAEFRHWFIGPTEPRTGHEIAGEPQPPYDFETETDGGPSEFACDQSPRVLYEIVKNFQFDDDEWYEFIDTLYGYSDFSEYLPEEDTPPQAGFFDQEFASYDSLYSSGFLGEWPIYLDLGTSRRMMDWAAERWDSLAALPEPWIAP